MDAGKANKTREPDSDLRCCWRRSRRRAAGPRILLRGPLATRRLDAFEHAVVLLGQGLDVLDKLLAPLRPERAARHSDSGIRVLRLGIKRVRRIQLWHPPTNTHARTQADKSSPMLNCIELFDELVQIPICGRVRVFVGVFVCAHGRACARARVFVCACVRASVCVRMRARECVRIHRHANHTHRLLPKRARAWAGDQPPTEQHCITQTPK